MSNNSNSNFQVKYHSGSISDIDDPYKLTDDTCIEFVSEQVKKVINSLFEEYGLPLGELDDEDIVDTVDEYVKSIDNDDIDEDDLFDYILDTIHMVINISYYGTYLSCWHVEYDSLSQTFNSYHRELISNRIKELPKIPITFDNIDLSGDIQDCKDLCAGIRDSIGDLTHGIYNDIVVRVLENISNETDIELKVQRIIMLYDNMLQLSEQLLIFATSLIQLQ